MMATGGAALRSMRLRCRAPSVATSWSCTILTTIWPGVTDFITSTPTACFFTCSVKARATSSATSASSSARRTSRSAASTSASRQRAAAGEAVENAAKFFRQVVEHSTIPYVSACGETSNTLDARGRIALSGGGLRPLKDRAAELVFHVLSEERAEPRVGA